jgi:hypothetical protein
MKMNFQGTFSPGPITIDFYITSGAIDAFRLPLRDPWTEKLNTETTDGNISYVLGGKNPIPESMFKEGGEGLYLEVDVKGEKPVFMELASVPFAHTALHAFDADRIKSKDGHIVLNGNTTVDGWLSVGGNLVKISTDTGISEISFSSNSTGAYVTAQNIPLVLRTSGTVNGRILMLTSDVGIGTAAPNYRLDVYGLIRTTVGYVCPDGTILTSTSAIATGTLAGGSYLNDVRVSSAIYASNAGYALNASTASYASNTGNAATANIALTANLASALTAGNYINDIKVSSAIYANNAGYALSVSTALYAYSTGNAGFALNASTASYAANAGNVNSLLTGNYLNDIRVSSAIYANNAGFAQSVSTALYANNSANATTANTALTAQQASGLVAGNYLNDIKVSSAIYASSAWYAVTSGTAGYASSAGSAVSANQSGYAVNAGTAVYTPNAGNAVMANTALVADGLASGSYTNDIFVSSSIHAIYAHHTGYAFNAGTATYAINAGTASYAGSAGSAVMSNTALVASGLVSGSYTNDIYVSSAIHSHIAGYAFHAGTATYASSAGNAVSANTAATASVASGLTTGSYLNDIKVSSAIYASNAYYSSNAGIAAIASGLTTGNYLNDIRISSSIYASNAGNAATANTAITASITSGLTSGNYTNDIYVSSSIHAIHAHSAYYALQAGSAAVLTGNININQINAGTLPGNVTMPVSNLLAGTFGSGSYTFPSNLAVTGSGFSVGTSTFVVSNGKIGIGITNPGYALHVFEPGNPRIVVESEDSSNAEINLGANGYNQNIYIDENGNLGLWNSTYGLSWTVLQNGNMGVGTPKPAYALDVYGMVRSTSGFVCPDGTILASTSAFSSALPITSASGQVTIANNTQVLGVFKVGDHTITISTTSTTDEIRFTGPQTSADIISQNLPLVIYSTGSVSNTLTLQTDGANIIMNPNLGNVFIGTAASTSSLTVNGIISATTFIGDGSQLSNINKSQWANNWTDTNYNPTFVTGSGISYTAGDNTGIAVISSNSSRTEVSLQNTISNQTWSLCTSGYGYGMPSGNFAILNPSIITNYTPLLIDQKYGNVTIGAALSVSGNLSTGGNTAIGGSASVGSALSVQGTGYIGGNVGIGTQPNTAAALQVRGGSNANLWVGKDASNSLFLWAVNDGDTAAVPINFYASSYNFTQGNVTIGATNSPANLTVNGTVTATSFSGLTTAWGNINGTLSNQSDLNTALENKAAKGANSDITSLSGLTTALSIAQGGTGQTSASAALMALGGSPSVSPTFTGTIYFPGSGVWNSSGNVGIGTNPGAYMLNVAGTANFAGIINGSITGNAATVTNGVTTTGSQTISGTKTFSGGINITGGGITSTSPTSGSWNVNGYFTPPAGFYDYSYDNDDELYLSIGGTNVTSGGGFIICDGSTVKFYSSAGCTVHYLKF